MSNHETKLCAWLSLCFWCKHHLPSYYRWPELFCKVKERENCEEKMLWFFLSTTYCKNKIHLTYVYWVAIPLLTVPIFLCAGCCHGANSALFIKLETFTWARLFSELLATSNLHVALHLSFFVFLSVNFSQPCFFSFISVHFSWWPKDLMMTNYAKVNCAGLHFGWWNANGYYVCFCWRW